MRVVVFVKASKESEAGVMPSEQLLTEMQKFNEELVKAGIWLDGQGLHPTSKAARIKFEWAKRCPNPSGATESELEIRPLFEAEDFGPEFTPELREKQARLQSEIEKQKK